MNTRRIDRTRDLVTCRLLMEAISVEFGTVSLP
jgi:hypothetical protein